MRYSRAASQPRGCHRGCQTPVTRQRDRPSEAGPVSDFVEATAGFEPAIRVLQTPALTTWLRRQMLFGAEEGI